METRRLRLSALTGGAMCGLEREMNTESGGAPLYPSNLSCNPLGPVPTTTVDMDLIPAVSQIN